MVEFDGLGHSAAIHTQDDDARSRSSAARVKAVRDHRERALVARRHRRHLQRVHAVADPRLRLVRPQLRVQQRLGGQPDQHQADRPAQQQPAVVQGAGRRPTSSRTRSATSRDMPDVERVTIVTDATMTTARASSTRSSTSCNRRAEQGRAADHRPGRARAVASQTVQAGRRADARTSGPTRSSRSAAARRWTPPRSCGCCTSTRRSSSPTCKREVLRRPQARVQVPRARRAGAAGVHPDHLGHRRRGDAVRGDHRHRRPGKKYPLADYALTPSVAIIDPVLTAKMPAVARRRLRLRRPDARHRGVRLGLRQRLHRRPGAAGDPADLREPRRTSVNGDPDDPATQDAREKMHNAGTIAGHGVRQRVPRHRARDGPRRRLDVPPRARPHQRDSAAARDPLQRHGPDQAHELAQVRALRRAGALPGDRRACSGLPASTPEEGVESYALAVEELRDAGRHRARRSRRRACRRARRSSAALDELAMNAYEDQCAPANPRMPMLDDMKDLMDRGLLRHLVRGGPRPPRRGREGR